MAEDPRDGGRMRLYKVDRLSHGANQNTLRARAPAEAPVEAPVRSRSRSRSRDGNRAA